MKHILELSSEQLFEVKRGLTLRVAECKKRAMAAKSTEGKLKCFEDLACAVSLLESVQDLS